VFRIPSPLHQNGEIRPFGDPDQRRLKPIRWADGETDATTCTWRSVERP